MEDRTTLAPSEYHPSAEDALKYISSFGLSELALLQESFSSCAIEGNRLAEVCSGTLRRLIAKEPVSDRYLLGLVWAIRNMRELHQISTGKGVR